MIEAPDDSSPARDPLVDDNAFGLWISWFDAEEMEYSQSSDKFSPRVRVFRSALSDYLESFELGREAIAIDLGTGLYLEVADGDQSEDPIAWIRSLRAFLGQGDWVTFAAIAYGGRWTATDPNALMAPRLGTVRVIASHGPSEPFRRTMAAEAMAHDDEDDAVQGWGPGLFIDADALEALQRKLKNAPTALRAGGTSFYRIGG